MILKHTFFAVYQKQINTSIQLMNNIDIAEKKNKLWIKKEMNQISTF